MTTTTQRRAKDRRAKQKLLKQTRRTGTFRRCFHGAGQWVPLGHAKPAPELESVAAKFGSPKFTEAEQTASPEAPYTRIVKDVLPVGRKLMGVDRDGSNDFWTVTQKTLADIESNYRLAQQRGYAANLTKGHGDEETMLVHPDDLIAPIDAAVVVGQTLWISCYVTPEQARYLSNPARKVSIGTLEPFVDGAGHTYPIQLVHVAVTDHPVVGGQGSFTRLQSPLGGGKAMDFKSLKTAINTLLEAQGIDALGDDVTEENIVERLVGIAHAIGGAPDDAPTDAPPADAGTPPMDTPPGDMLMSLKPGQQPTDAQQKALAAILSPLLAPLTEGMKTLAADLKSLKGDKVAEVKARFLSRLSDLGKAGLPAVRIERLKKAGEKCSYDPDVTEPMLEGAATEPGVNMRRLSKPLATGEVPTVPGAGGRLSDEDMAKKLQEKGIKPAWNRTAASAAKAS